MLVCNPYEIIIHGTTSNGKVFRPSDWAERLCGILSSFDKGNRLSYHEWVHPILVDKIRCVAVDKKLEEINPAMFRFLMDFAADNDLRVMDCQSLMDEQAAVKEPAQQPAAPAPAVEAAVKETAEAQAKADTDAEHSVLREIGEEETAVAFAALSVLRTMHNDVSRFVEQINHYQRPQGYRLLGIFEEGKTNAVAVCGFREQTNLASGRHIHIDDVVTIPQGRSKGYAARLLAEVQKIAREAGISKIHVQSDVGSERTPAHRLYFESGFEIDAFHFVCKVD
ncbi:GNAT family N-acetyltransferase [Neisseria zoodegmatis]|uniref:GNAT family N-acetyltransferase n=1 Tax=Neisseria zoodegmatis TaxID=326523 RepID=A0AB38DQE0_9NEIS|nr:GNAT family N-acetyltransferase [Neisseria zoodegmatis]OSI10507.1 GNAT family N-acetyltransferase [Neisseria zoodegmatis]SNU79212.1 PhnO-like protein [Neisseria zoodegmatis]